MAKLKDFPIFDLTAGLVTNKSDVQLQDNELKDSTNYDLEEIGRLKRRAGIRQFGDTKSGILDNSFPFIRQVLGSSSGLRHMVVDRADDATMYRVLGSYTTAAAAVGDITLDVVKASSNFSGTGTIEVNGRLMTYTGASATQFTGIPASGAGSITVAIPAFSAATQLVSDGKITGLDTRDGCYFSIINNVLFINGRDGSFTYDNVNYTAVGDADEPAGLFSTNYRDRIYLAGSGVTNAAGNRNSAINRVSFSDAGDATSWTLTNFFDVEDDRGEMITGFKEVNDTLLIFKQNSIFSYDEIQLKQRLWNVGAYNHRVIKKIGELVYTFCPSGVFVTSGVDAQKISEPVKKYLQHFRAQYTRGTLSRVVENCFAGTFRNKYYLYIGDIAEPESKSDVVLVYDTLKGNWTVHDSYTDITHFASLNAFRQGSFGAAVQTQVNQDGETLFAGDGSGKYYRLFEDRFLDNETTRSYRGGDLTANMQSNNDGSAIQTVAETKWYNMGDEPTQWAKIDRISVLIETGSFQVSYRLDRGSEGFTDWISLGEFNKNTEPRKLKEKLHQGYRIAFKITSNQKDTITKLNGLILKDRETVDMEKYGINR